MIMREMKERKLVRWGGKNGSSGKNREMVVRR